MRGMRVAVDGDGGTGPGGGGPEAAADAARDALEHELAAALEQQAGLLGEVSAHLRRSGGKRLRPALVMLCAEAGPAGPAGAGVAMPLAVACEILHTATLVHDDVIDGASLRRGLPTVAAKWGGRVAILAGDYLFARALTRVSELGNPEISIRLGMTIQSICEAELEQVERAYDVSYSETEYIELIRRKSALLIAECCRSGALLAGAAPEIAAAVFRYGELLGIAYQITDDILDVVAAEAQVGKSTGRDIELGLLTLPVIRAVGAVPELGSLLRGRLGGGAGERRRALELVRAGGGVEYAQALAEGYARRAAEALADLPGGEPRASLEQVAHFVTRRTF